jgi:hypothetical protein
MSVVQCPLVPAKAGTQSAEPWPLDSRLRGNERRFWGAVRNQDVHARDECGMTDGGAEDCNELDALD